MLPSDNYAHVSGQEVRSSSSAAPLLPVESRVIPAAKFLPPFAESYDLLCFSHLRWNFVTQRPQHLLTRCAKERRTFFWEEPVFDVPSGSSSYAEITSEQPNLWVIRPHVPLGLADPDGIQRLLLDDFITSYQVRRFVRWYYTPMAIAFTRHLQAQATVYDCMDELSGFLGAPAELGARELELFSAADVVFTGGTSLYEAKKKYHSNVHVFPSSIDVQHFTAARQPQMDPEDQAAIPHPRVGFFGVLDERFDRELVATLARLRPHHHFIFLGPVAKIATEDLPVAPNLHYLGSKSYANLPRYIAGWDAAMLPFVLNESTRFISPTKVPEYLASGKPVVSTPIHDVIGGYGNLVAIAANAPAFATTLDQVLEPQAESWHRNVSIKLAESSWDGTWAQMSQHIENVLQRSARDAVKSVIPVRTVGFGTNSARRIPANKDRYDYLIVGAGLAGSVLAERLATVLDQRVLLIDTRDHVGGNTFDFCDEAGILVHKYGPHIFHTNSGEVVRYLSQFTEWRPYAHHVLSSVDGKLLPVPINLNTINQLYNLNLDADGMKNFLSARTPVVTPIRTSEEIVVSRVGRELYEKFFHNYTRKQWGLDPSQLDASVAGRIPVRFNGDNRYFDDAFQAMPLRGYTHMFERMLDSPRITIRLGVAYRDLLPYQGARKTIFTGPIDEYFDYRFGPLPYRSLEFRHQTFDQEQYQGAAVINYPNEYDYTRVTEFKHLTGQISPKTSVVFEYPREEGDPYYPIPRPENAAIYKRYRTLADHTENVHFVGRLASYRYYNMDQVVAQALTEFRKIVTVEGSFVTTQSA